MTIRLDAIKKILAALFYEQGRFEGICPELEDTISLIDIIYKIDKILDEKAFTTDNTDEVQEINDFPIINFDQKKTMQYD